MAITDKDVHEAFNIILSDRKAYNTSLNYAISYIKEGLNMGGDDLFVQVQYVLSNITHWRHPSAKAVRETLKEYIRQGRA